MPIRQFLSGHVANDRSSGFVIAMSLLLLLCWMLGGVTVDSTSADEILQLASLPILAWGLWRFSGAPPSRSNAMAVGLMLAIVAIPLWQLLPMPHGIGMAGRNPCTRWARKLRRRAGILVIC